MYSSSNTNLDRCSAGHLHSLPHDCALFQVSDAVLSKKNDGSKNDGSKTRSVERVEYSPRLVSSSQTGLSSNPSQAVSVESLPGGTCLSPIAGAYGAHEQPLKGGVHQAKRTRVENIIRDMTGSSHEQLTHTAIEEGHKAELNSIPERHRSPESPRDRVNTQRGGAGNSGDRSSEDLTKMKKLPRKFKPLRKLQIGLTHGGWRRESEGTGEKCAVEDYPTRSDSHSNDDFNERNKLRLINNPQSKPDKVNVFLADILKYELSRAVNTSVDSIFKGMPLLERSSVVDRSAGTEIRNPSPLKTQPSPVHEDTKSAFSQYADEILEFHIPEVQTEALSLVVHRPLQSTTCAPNTLPGTKNCHHHNPEPLFPSSHQAAPHERRASEYIPSTSRLNNLRRLKDARCHGVEAAKLEALDPSWDSTKARSKVTSRSIRGSQTQRVAEPVLLESLCLPHVKTESDGLQSLGRNNMFVLNEGLTTNHLKKAKLMFFYTRYPSSLVLKTFFHDVQFTRCITSQLIKWFSNFREFYYIQMEKYARHNVTEGEAGVRDLTVGRESELFRTLNMHYNKANDFQVPERFLEVAEITLREFYIAISVGKDSDPSWKKPIYKVICKLDSEVPNEFKTHSSE